MERAAIFLAEGFEEIEGLTVVDLLRRAGITIDMVSVSGTLSLTGSHGIKVLADFLFEEYPLEEAIMLILPGGPGTKHLLLHTKLHDVLGTAFGDNKLLAAICAAPSVLGSLGILEGKKAACFPGYEDKLTGATISYEEVVTDGSIITSRGLGTAIPFALAIIEYALGKEAAKNVKDAIQYCH